MKPLPKVYINPRNPSQPFSSEPVEPSQDECDVAGECLHNHTRFAGHLRCPVCRAPEYFPCSVECIKDRVGGSDEDAAEVRWDAHFALSKREQQ